MKVSAIRYCEVSLDALNYLVNRMDGNDHIMPLRGKTLRGAKQFFAALICDELYIG